MAGEALEEWPWIYRTSGQTAIEKFLIDISKRQVRDSTESKHSKQKCTSSGRRKRREKNCDSVIFGHHFVGRLWFNPGPC